MRRNVIAAAMQVAGAVAATVGAFAISWQAGTIAAGVVAVVVGLGLEGEL